RKSSAAMASGAVGSDVLRRLTPSTNDTANASTAIPVTTSRMRSARACTLPGGEGVPEADGARVNRAAGIHQVGDACAQDVEHHLVERVRHAGTQHGTHLRIERASGLEEVGGVECTAESVEGGIAERVERDGAEQRLVVDALCTE